MKRRRSPGEKKALAYEKDHIIAAKHRHGFRKQWPLNKAHANRRYRRQVHQLLAAAQQIEAPEQLDELPPLPVHRHQVRKWPSSVVRLDRKSVV